MSSCLQLPGLGLQRIFGGGVGHSSTHDISRGATRQGERVCPGDLSAHSRSEESAFGPHVPWAGEDRVGQTDGELCCKYALLTLESVGREGDGQPGGSPSLCFYGKNGHKELKCKEGGSKGQQRGRERPPDGAEQGNTDRSDGAEDGSPREGPLSCARRGWWSWRDAVEKGVR